MLLSEIRSTFPRVAGSAWLILSDEVKRPTRSSSTITLPNTPRAEFFPLKRGSQFLFSYLYAGYETCWFGGVDEEAPFLFELQVDAYDAFQEKGARGFYAALKPKRIAKLERVLKRPANRQGPIWYLPFMWSWSEVDKIFTMSDMYFEQNPADWRVREVHGMRVFDTNHVLTGQAFEARNRVYSEPALIASGVLKAKDYAPVKLGVPHLLTLSRNLYGSGDAD